MAKVILFLIIALIFLGYLINKTIDMQSDMTTLIAENKKLRQELDASQVSYNACIQAADTLQDQYNNLQNSYSNLEQAYDSEHVARLGAETKAASLERTIAYLQAPSSNFQAGKVNAQGLNSQASLPMLLGGISMVSLAGGSYLGYLQLRRKNNPWKK